MIDGDQFYGPRAPHIPDARAALRAPSLYWSVPGPMPDLDQLLPAGPADGLNVYANQGRWVVSCPTCNGSQLASRKDPRFICCDCGNVAVEGRWRRIHWPTNSRAVEALLDIRPVANQNWWPHETLDDLRDENARHGLSEPPPFRTAQASGNPAPQAF